MPRSNKETRISAELRNELRRLVSLKAYAYVNTKSQMKKHEQHSLMEEMYHGMPDKNMVSQIGMLVRGEGVYSALYTKEGTVITDPNTSASSSNMKLVLKKMLSRSDASIVAGKQITRAVLEKTSFTGKALVTGRMLHSQALYTLKTHRLLTALPLLLGGTNR